MNRSWLGKREQWENVLDIGNSLCEEGKEINFSFFRGLEMNFLLFVVRVCRFEVGVGLFFGFVGQLGFLLDIFNCSFWV